MKKAWIILFYNFPETGEPIQIRGVYDSKEKACKGFEKCLRENWKQLTEDEDECDWDCHGNFDECVKNMDFENHSYRLSVEAWNVNEDWKGSIFW